MQTGQAQDLFNMQTGQAQDLPLQGWRRRTSVGATLLVARSLLPVSKTQCMGTYEEGATTAGTLCPAPNRAP
jgi:hypothetical protein